MFLNQQTMTYSSKSKIILLYQANAQCKIKIILNDTVFQQLFKNIYTSSKGQRQIVCTACLSNERGISWLLQNNISEQFFSDINSTEYKNQNFDLTKSTISKQSIHAIKSGRKYLQLIQRCDKLILKKQKHLNR